MKVIDLLFPFTNPILYIYEKIKRKREYLQVITYPIEMSSKIEIKLS